MVTTLHYVKYVSVIYVRSHFKAIFPAILHGLVDTTQMMLHVTCAESSSVSIWTGIPDVS